MWMLLVFFSRYESLHWSKIMEFILFPLSQINVDKFNVGRFLSHTSDGCPDGYMTISERDFTPMDGRWCGTAWGYNVYYSESSSIAGEHDFITEKLPEISTLISNSNYSFTENI